MQVLIVVGWYEWSRICLSIQLISSLSLSVCVYFDSNSPPHFPAVGAGSLVEYAAVPYPMMSHGGLHSDDAYSRTFASTADTNSSDHSQSHSHPQYLHPDSTGPAFPFSSLPFPRPTAAPPGLSGPIWNGGVPFSFQPRQERIDFPRLLNIDLEKIVRERDIRTLQKWTHMLTFGDIKPDDIGWFDRDGRDGESSGAANAIHLFRLAQLTMESLMHVQGFLMKSIQAKEGAVAAAESRSAARESRDAALIGDLRRQIAKADKAANRMRAKIDGFERAGARIQPVTYLPAAAAIGKPVPQAVYPGEVYPCALCGTAFQSPHFLTAHYARRHAGFVHPAQTIVDRPVVVKQDEYKESPSALTQADVDRQLGDLRRSLESQLASHAAQRHHQDQQALLARLNGLEALMRGQFASATIPREMLASQQSIYDALLKEIEAIKEEIARDAHIAWERQNAQPNWQIQQQQQQQQQPQPQQQQRSPKPTSPPHTVKPPPAQRVASMPIVRTEPASPAQLSRQVSLPSESPHSPHRPAPLAILSPTNSIEESPPPQPERARSSDEVRHLSRADRLRAVLLRRMHAGYAPFAEFPTLCSRYPVEDWDPSAASDYHELEIVLDQLVRPENQDQLAIIEEEMHAQETAKECYNNIYDIVDNLLDGVPPARELVDSDRALADRWAFLPIWLKLILDRDARDADKIRERERIAAEEAARRQHEADEIARAAEAARRQQEDERMRQEQRREFMKHELEYQDRLKAQSLHGQLSPLQTDSTTGGDSVDPTGSPYDRIDAMLSPRSTTATKHIFSPSNQAPEGALAIQVSSPSRNQANYSHAVLRGLETPAGEGFDPYASHGRTGESTPQAIPFTPLVRDYSGSTIMRSSRGPAPALPPRTPLSVVRPEGAQRINGEPTPLARVTPQTPAANKVTNTGAKTPLAVFTPSARQQQLEVPASSPAAQQIGGNFSPSSSTSSLDGSRFDRFGHSFGGSGIMGRSVGGGLTHISEGGSIDDSRIASNLSRRNSLEQEAKYADGPTAPSSPIVIPRTTVDDEFEEIISPRKVAPRTQPSIVVTPSAAETTAPTQNTRIIRPNHNTANQFMVATPQHATSTQPIVSTSSSNTLTLPPAPYVDRSQFAATTPMNHNLPTDRLTSQPGSFAYTMGGVSVAPLTAPTPSNGPGFTPHSHSVGGHSFQFGNAVTEGNENEHDTTEQHADPNRSQQDQRHATLRREEEEALGLSPTADRTIIPLRVPTAGAASPSRPATATSSATIMPRTIQAQPAASFGHSLNDSLEETIHLSEPTRPANKPATVIGTQQFQPHVVTSVLSPTSVLSQPGRPSEPASPAPIASSSLTVPPSMAFAPTESTRAENEVQSFHASPAASMSENATKTIVPTHEQSQTQTTLVSKPRDSTEQRTQPTFLSDYHDDEFDFEADHASSVAPSAAGSVASAAVSAGPAPSSSSGRTASGWLPAVQSDDDIADGASDSEDEEDLYGRPKKKRDLDVIAPGSVSNAKAQLVRQQGEEWCGSMHSCDSVGCSSGLHCSCRCLFVLF